MATDALVMASASAGARADAAGVPACAHCGLPAPGAREADGADAHVFCCEGCRAAYAVIRGCGLERYYALREGAGAAVTTPSRRYTEYDDATFQRLYARDAAGGLRTAELLLQGVHCPACVWLLERLPAVVEGVVSCTLDYRRATLTVTWDPTRGTLSGAARALATLGYAPHPARGVKAREVRRRDDRAGMVRLGVAGACAGNVMLLYFGLYAGMFQGIDPAHATMLRWASFVLTAIAVLGPGWVIFRGAWGALRARAMHLDIPLALGLGGGLAWGFVNTVLNQGEIYFDSISALVFFLLAGRFVQQRQSRAAGDSVELLLTLTPTSARRVEEDGAVLETPVEALREGDVVEVLAGECFPADGAVVRGSSGVDRSLLTGESRPAPVGVGDEVHAGTLNLGGVLRVRVTASGEETRVGKLMKLVEEGSRTRAPLVQMADRLAGTFLVVMVVLALLTIAGWWWMGEPMRGLSAAVALLVVTCPCGLGLATPLVMTMAMGRAARAGILIKSAEAIEKLARGGKRGGVMLLDKTGTLTHGRTRVAAWQGEARVRSLVRALERTSSHHAARALAEDGAGDEGNAGEMGDAGDDLRVTASREFVGRGIEGIVDGRFVRVGTPSFVRESAVTSAWDERAEAEVVERGLTPVLASVGGVVEGVAGLGDALREDARDAVGALRSRGWRVRVLSGDDMRIAQSAGRELGIESADVLGGLLPEDKLAIVEREKRSAPSGRAPVVMVGDGVNDAPALAAADVGVSVRGGAEASMAAADVYLGRGGIGQVRELLDASVRTMRVMRLVIGVSVAYNVIAAALCVSGHVNALWAAVIMPMSSLSVLAIALRARTFDVARSDMAAPRERGKP